MECVDVSVERPAYLAGLVGSFQPFAKTRAEREQSGDSRPSIEERYTNRQDYLQRVRRAASLVRQRFVLDSDVEALVSKPIRPGVSSSGGEPDYFRTPLRSPSTMRKIA